MSYLACAVDCQLAGYSSECPGFSHQFDANQSVTGLKIHGSKFLLLSLRAGSKTIFVVANLWGFERPRPIHSSKLVRQRVSPQVCYNVINIMIYGRRGCILFDLITSWFIALENSAWQSSQKSDENSENNYSA